MPSTMWPYRRFPVQSAVHNDAEPFLTGVLACISGFWFLITLLVLSRGLVSAEWVALEKKYQMPGLQTMYFDPDTIHREHDLVTLWQLTDYTWMQGGPRSTPRFLSTKTQKQFDCAAKRLRLLAFTQFARRMGTGRAAAEYVDKDKWLPVKSESIDHALWGIACGKQ